MNPPIPPESAILEVLRLVEDPEVGCNIVDLGLIYDVQSNPGNVKVRMTLTTPGCPLHESITWGVENALLTLPGITAAAVELVWDPPWQPAMMTTAGREATGYRS